MWFQFPTDTNAISVQNQEFRAEVRDGEGREYFRAPDHFAPIILDQPGFAAKSPPNTDLGDLPAKDPLRDGALAQLTAQVGSSRQEIDTLKALLATVSVERDEWKKRALEAETKLANAEAEATAPPPVEKKK
jgi:hypothetical protein